MPENEIPGGLRVKVFHRDSENAEGIRWNAGFEKVQDVASENLRIIGEWIAARDEGRAIDLDRRKHFHFHREKCSRKLAEFVVRGTVFGREIPEWLEVNYMLVLSWPVWF